MAIITTPNIVTGGQVEKYGDGDSWTVTIGAAQTATGGRLLEAMAGDRIARTAQAGSVVVLGVAMMDGAAAAKVTVAAEGVWMLTASGTIAAGSRVIAGAGGVVVQAGATPDARTVVGIALADAVDTGLVPVKVG